LTKPLTPVDAELLLRTVLDTVPIRVFWKDTKSTFLGGNQLFLQDLNIKDVNDLIGKNDFDFVVCPEDAEHFRNHDAEVINSGIPLLNIEEYQVVRGQPARWLRTNKVPMFNKDHELIGIIGTYEDITKEVEYRQEIEEHAVLDALTGVSNRRKLQQTIETCTSQCNGLLFIDLDHFKSINDSLGHSVGDIILQKVAQRLVHLTKHIDNVLITRLGGDEFGILLPYANSENAQAKLEALASKVLDSLLESFTIEHQVINLGASIGITIIDKQSSSTLTGFTEADMAMYAAKAKGRNNYQFYDVTMKEAAEKKHRLKTCLHRAIENKELSLVFQPQFDHEDNVIGAEALLRWNSKELGFVPPDEFIPLAEESGLIHSIGDWVLNSALDTLAEYLPLLDDNSEFKMAVNFSSQQFKDVLVAKSVEKCLSIRNIDPRHLQIEITESVLIDQQDRVVKSMLQLQRYGVSIAIDDFGTGYSSLSYLAILPIDKLKIDRAFVSDLHIKSTNRKLVDTLVNMSKNLQMEVIAEGVETEHEKEALMALGCFQFQGYYFCRPVSSEQFKLKYL
jgi:diguanylate cyclase (GGDEF)-like protein